MRGDEKHLAAPELPAAGIVSSEMRVNVIEKVRQLFARDTGLVLFHARVVQLLHCSLPQAREAVAVLQRQRILETNSETVILTAGRERDWRMFKDKVRAAIKGQSEPVHYYDVMHAVCGVHASFECIENLTTALSLALQSGNLMQDPPQSFTWKR